MKYKAGNNSIAVPPLAPADRPAIADAAAHWSLNPEQFAAFVPIACALLDICLSRLQLRETSASSQSAATAACVNALTDDEVKRIRSASDTLRALIAVSRTDTSTSAANERIDAISEAAKPSERQSMFMLITGSGGTGKSRVIHCVRDFARRWLMSNALRVTATTGAAAANVQASTWQSTVGDHFMRKTTRAVSEEVRNLWSSIGLMIVDEISMAGAVSLVRLDQHLRVLKDNDVLFGGVHMVVLGDFWQLGAVRQSPVYGTSANSKAKPASVEAAAKGHQIWRKLTNGVELITNMRAAQDKPFAALLENFRVNQGITQPQIDVLNKTCEITAERQPPPGTALF
jgi:hypothetical protein